MKQKTYIQKTILAVLLMFAVQVVFASLSSSGITNSNKKTTTNKYSLRNLSKYSNKSLSLTSLRLNSKLKAVELGCNKSNIQLTNGNTTFIYPYKTKIKVPKFKVPSPTNF